jgi:hypothetical protein
MAGIRVNRLVLEDTDGTARAELSVAGGSLSLRLSGGSPPPRPVGGIEEGDSKPDPEAIFRSRPSLSLCGENGRAIAMLCIDNGYFAMLLLDENGKCRASLGISDCKPPWLTFSDENGNSIWEAP